LIVFSQSFLILFYFFCNHFIGQFGAILGSLFSGWALEDLRLLFSILLGFWCLLSLNLLITFKKLYVPTDQERTPLLSIQTEDNINETEEIDY